MSSRYAILYSFLHSILNQLWQFLLRKTSFYEFLRFKSFLRFCTLANGLCYSVVFIVYKFFSAILFPLQPLQIQTYEFHANSIENINVNN